MVLADNFVSAEVSAELGWLVVVGTGKLAALEGRNGFCLPHTFRRLIRRRKMGWQTPGKEAFSSWALEAWQCPLGQIARE